MQVQQQIIIFLTSNPGSTELQVATKVTNRRILEARSHLRHLLWTGKVVSLNGGLFVGKV